MKRVLVSASVCALTLLFGALAAPAIAQTQNCAGVTAQVVRNKWGVDGMLGLRRGMTLNEVRAVMACVNPQYKLVREEKSATQAFQMYGQPRVEAQKVTTLRYRKGLDKLAITMMGEPMHVTHLWQMQDFEFDGRTKESIVSDLVSTYGPFGGPQPQYNGESFLAGWCEGLGGMAPVDEGCRYTVSYKLSRTQVQLTLNYEGDSGKHFRPALADAAYLRDIEID